MCPTFSCMVFWRKGSPLFDIESFMLHFARNVTSSLLHSSALVELEGGGGGGVTHFAAANLIRMQRIRNVAASAAAEELRSGFLSSVSLHSAHTIGKLLLCRIKIVCVYHNWHQLDACIQFTKCLRKLEHLERSFEVSVCTYLLCLIW